MCAKASAVCISIMRRVPFAGITQSRFVGCVLSLSAPLYGQRCVEQRKEYVDVCQVIREHLDLKM